MVLGQCRARRAAPALPVRGGFGRELAGALAVGLSVLAIVIVVFQVLAWVRDVPGPGAAMVFGHLGAAVLAVLVQRVADKVFLLTLSDVELSAEDRARMLERGFFNQA